jgi:hypothetical protein
LRERLSDDSDGRLEDGERVADDGDAQLGGGERSDVDRQRPVTMVKEHSAQKVRSPDSSGSGRTVSVPEPSRVDLANYPEISHADLSTILTPTYLETLPETDGWGSPYESRLNVVWRTRWRPRS